MQKEALSPVKLVECAISKNRCQGLGNAFDAVYAVVDRDQTTNADFTEAFALAKRASTKTTKFYVVVTDICFKAWLLAHYGPVPPVDTPSALVDKAVTVKILSDKRSKKVLESFPYLDFATALNNMSIIQPNTLGSHPSSALPELMKEFQQG
ncbi:RloB family protein [Corynebacterium choanae]|uniref:RloB domain-containing protein n=1 Tax=Corynebacterium choanae TaxID=1862358 RepID=A0A3G6J5D1_9CORY|nr:RloB family protein [Corynebacterium choanae]AZA13247.1 hypothetical protein CCHOA_04190 [Corynebacterium choanae]